jgi:hypothetical protein
VERLRFAIGEWHLLPHKKQCHLQYNAKFMMGAGLVFGDVIEHLWSESRPHSRMTVYMSAAARQDYLTQLVRAS